MIVPCISWARAHMQLVKTASYVFLGLLVVVDVVIPRHHPHFLGDLVPGFWALFGLIACVLIVVVSKWLGKRFLFREENYYDQSEENNHD